MTRGIRSSAAIAEALSAAGAPGGPLSPDALLELDDRQEFPAHAAKLLDELGVPAFYIDRGSGALLDGLSDLAWLVRLIARRDLTIAVGHAKTFLGSVSVWLAGDAGQRERLAADVVGGAVVSWGLTERGHGADLLAGELSAERSGSGWLMTGEKWLINNATRGALICVLARTAPAAGARGLSLFLVDKRTADPRTWRTLPKVPTHGIRGADISGIAFSATPLGPEALIGEPGAGLETTLKALQLTRTMCCGLSLGALDHALELGAHYVRHRNLYGTTLADVPYIRRELGQAVASLHVAEAVTFVAARLAASATDEMAVVSAVAKALVPELCQEAVSAVGEILGLRGYLAAHEPSRAFQKLDRDHRIVSVFDGGTAVCRSQLIEHFPLLSKRIPGADGRRILLEAGPRTPDPTRLSVLSRRCSLTDGFAADCDLIARQAAAGELPGWIAETAAAVRDSLNRTRAAMAHRSWRPHEVPQEAFDLARDFELCFAAAAICHLWVHARPDRDDPGQLWSAGRWLGGALAVIAGKLPCGARSATGSADTYNTLADALLSAADAQVPALLGTGARTC